MGVDRYRFTGEKAQEEMVEEVLAFLNSTPYF